MPGNLGTTSSRPPLVSDYIRRHPAAVLEAERSPRASWPAAVLALGLPALVGLALSRGRR